MAMDIGQTFLGDSKKSEFTIWREPREFRRNIHGNLDFAALTKSVGEGCEDSWQSHLVQQRRVQEIGRGANFVQGSCKQGGYFLRRTRSRLAQFFLFS